MDDDEIGLLVTAATDAADDAGLASDYRGKYVLVGRGFIYAGSALALSISKFAGAIHPEKEKQ